ncbi:MAG: polymorphic toxin type 33 domain-containing protein [Candidatus Entotheonellia bacterium]
MTANAESSSGSIIIQKRNQKLRDAGCDIHDLKGGKRAAQYDFHKDTSGNLYVEPKGGTGHGEPTGINIDDL